MKKFKYTAAIAILAAGFLLTANARAQQTPAPATPVPAPKASASGTGTAGKAPAAASKAPAAKSKSAASTVTLDSPKAKASYAIGLNIGKGMNKNAVDVDPDVLFQGLKDGLTGAPGLMSDDEIKAVLTALQTHMKQMADEKAKQAGDANKTEGEAYLAANKSKPGVVTLPSGLQYKVITMGTGPKPAATDSVECNYKGTLINGTEFDSSYKRGQPATFAVNQVIKGWTEALQLMPVGSKWQLFIPSDLAYAQRGAGADIGPNATLIFEVELLSIQQQPKPMAPVPTPGAAPAGGATPPPTAKP